MSARKALHIIQKESITMSEQEKAKIIEEHLPTAEAVIDEYRT